MAHAGSAAGGSAPCTATAHDAAPRRPPACSMPTSCEVIQLSVTVCVKQLRSDRRQRAGGVPPRCRRSAAAAGMARWPHWARRDSHCLPQSLHRIAVCSPWQAGAGGNTIEAGRLREAAAQAHPPQRQQRVIRMQRRALLLLACAALALAAAAAPAAAAGVRGGPPKEKPHTSDIPYIQCQASRDVARRAVSSVSETARSAASRPQLRRGARRRRPLHPEGGALPT